MEALLTWFAAHFDIPVLDWIADKLWCPVLDAIMPWITLLGDGGIFWIAIAVILICIPKYRKAGLSMGIALLMGLLLCNLTLKPLVARIRPYTFVLENYGKNIALLVSTPSDYSFPSGHTIASFEAAIALLIHDRRLGIPATVLACLVAFSRLYLYLHYPTDVISSVLLGSALAVLSCWLVKKGFGVWEKRKHGQ